MDHSGTLFSYLWRIATVLLLVLANGFFVTSEFALIKMRRSKVTALAANGNRKAQRVLKALDHLDAYISATQLGITLASLALGWVGEPTVAALFEPLFDHASSFAAKARQSYCCDRNFIRTDNLFYDSSGRAGPKDARTAKIAARRNGRCTTDGGFPESIQGTNIVINQADSAIGRLMGLTTTAGHTGVYTAEEFRQLIELSNKSSHISKSQGQMLARALDFSGLTAHDAMIPQNRGQCNQ